MSTKHTPEPWKLIPSSYCPQGVNIADSGGRLVPLDTGFSAPDHNHVHFHQAQLNAPRIVACVNLLAPHPDLAGVEVVSGDLMTEIRSILAEALEDIPPSTSFRKDEHGEMRAIPGHVCLHKRITEALGLLGRGPQ